MPQMLLPAGSQGEPVSSLVLAIVVACCAIVFAYAIREANR